jgi:hypothetical protein
MVGWGVPRNEAEVCFSKIDEDKGGTISRAEFFAEYEPIWQYQMDNMLSAVQKFKSFTSQEARRMEAEAQAPTEKKNAADTPVPV